MAAFLALVIPDAWAIPLGTSCLMGVATWVLWVTVSTFRNNDDRERSERSSRPTSRRESRRYDAGREQER